MDYWRPVRKRWPIPPGLEVESTAEEAAEAAAEAEEAAAAAAAEAIR